MKEVDEVPNLHWSEKMSRRKRGPISKEVRNLCYRLFQGRITDNDFKKRIQDIIDKYGQSGYILQGIGLAIQKWGVNENGHKKWSINEDEYKKEKVWQLADEVDVRIRKLFENWVRKMSE